MILSLTSAIRQLKPAHLKALVAQKRGLKDGEQIARIASYRNDVILASSRLNEYTEVCEFGEQAEVPPTYPHIIAFELHMANMLSDTFPIPLLGIVHVRNSIKQSRAISRVEKLNFHCFIDGNRSTDKGIEFDLQTEIRSGEDLIWQSTSTMLWRQKQKGQSKPSAKEHVEFGHAEASNDQWKLKRDLGRRYAAVSGDFNPIHLTGFSAKLFGFKAPIIHGMWSLARAVAALAPQQYPVRVDCQFKLPCFLPTRTTFRHWQEGNQIHFGMLSSDGSKPHVIGTCTQGDQE